MSEYQSTGNFNFFVSHAANLAKELKKIGEAGFGHKDFQSLMLSFHVLTKEVPEAPAIQDGYAFLINSALCNFEKFYVTLVETDAPLWIQWNNCHAVSGEVPVGLIASWNDIEPGIRRKLLGIAFPHTYSKSADLLKRLIIATSGTTAQPHWKNEYNILKDKLISGQL